MQLILKRINFTDSYTEGELYIDGNLFCRTIEDKYRELPVEKKIAGQTCIPYGTYKITLNVKSPKYSKRESYKWCEGYLPRLINVPYFEGILIHGGNSADDSAGCLLVGQYDSPGRIKNSQMTLKKLYALLKNDRDNLKIIITR